MSDKIKSLYKALKADGADVGTEQEFTDWFQAPGEEGYKNRKYVYDTFKADGADIGNSYEEFRDWLGLKARKQPLVQPNQQYSQRVIDAHDSPTNVAPNYKDHAQIAKELGELNKPVAAESTRVAKPVVQPQRRNTNVIRQKQNPLPQGFGELSPNLIPSAIMSEYEQDARRTEDYGNNIEQIARTNDAIRTINGQGSPKGKERLRAMAQQLKDRADYAKATEGKELKDEVLDLTDIGITPTLARDEEGNPLVNENGTPIMGIENSQVKANTQGYMQQQTYKDDLARNIQQNQEELAKLQEELKELKQNQAPKVLSPFDLSLDDGSGMFTADTDISAMSTAIRLKQETIERLQDALDRSNQSFWHGAGTEVWNENNFLFGIQGFADNVTLERVKMKVENGEQISLAERALLETSMESDRAKTIEQQTASDFYNYGKTAGKAVHLVKDFLLGGKIIKSLMGGGAALGVSVADAVGANGVSRILLKGLGIGMGDLAAGFGMTTTIQSAETASRIMEKNLGNVTQDEQGNFKFEGGKDALRATFEGIVENTIENATEAGGVNEALGGVVSRALGKRGLGWVSRAVNNLTTNKFLRSARIQSLPEEILEEYEGQIAQGLLVDSEQLKELGDAKTHKDIILGTVFSMGVLQAPHLAHKAIEKGYNATQYYRYKRKVDKADKAAFDELEDKWESLRSRIDGTTNDDMAALTQEIADSNQYTDLEKIYISRYIYNLTFMRGYNSAEMNNAKGIAKGEEDVTDDEEADDTEQLLASEDVGYNATEPEEKQRIKNQLQLRMQTSTEVLGEDVIKRLEDSPIPTLLELRERGEEAEINAALDYLNAQYAYNGMVDGAQDRIQAAQEQAEYVIKRRTNFTTLGEPTIIPVITQQGKRMYITDGEVTALEDGSIDLTNSNDDLIAVDEEGNVSFLSAKDIKTVEEQINPAQALEETRNNIAQELSKKEADEIDGVLPFLPNDVYQGSDEQGTPLQITILQDNGDGNVIANVTGLGEGVVIPKQTIQQWVDGLRMANLQQEEAERLAQYEPAEEYDYEQGADIEGYEPVEDYSEYVNIGNDGNEYEQPFEGVTPEEAQAEAEQYQANRPAMEKIPVLRDAEGNPILNKKGRPQYQWTQAPVETTADALADLNDGILVDARDTAQSMKKQADERLQKVKAQKVKGDDPIEEAESRKQIRNQVQAAQAEVDYWKNVTQEINRRMSAESARIQAEIEAEKTQEQKEAEEAERKRIAAELDAKEREAIRKEIEKDSKKRNEPYKPLTEAKKEMADDDEAMAILNDTEPRDLAEWVSSLIKPHSMLWQDENGQRGLQSELGLNRSDIQKFISLLAQRDNGGKPFAEVVDEIYSELPDAMKTQYTDQDVRNTLLDLFNEGSVARMRNLAEEHRIEEAKAQYEYNRRREEEAELQAWADAFHLSPEERESFEAWMEEDTPIPLSDEELAHIINIIDEQENEQSGGSQEVGNKPDTRAEDTGNNELPSEQPRAETTEQPEQGSEDNAVEGENEPANVEPTATSGNGYTITPTKYTTKRGKELDMYLVKFDDDFTKNKLGWTNAKQHAKDMKGWWDRKNGGFLMRSEDDARSLAERVILEDKMNDAAEESIKQELSQPITLADIQSVTDEAESKPQEQTEATTETTEQPQTDANETAKKMYKEVSKLMQEKLLMPNGLANVHFDTIELHPFVNDRDVTEEHRNDVHSFDGIHRNRDGSLQLNEGNVVLASVSGLAPEEQIIVLQKALDKLKGEQQEATTETPQPEQPKEQQKPPKSKYVSDEDAERFAQLKERLRQKLLGQMNMGIDPEIFTLGVEMTYMIVKNQARKFADYAKAMIEEMGDAIRPYLKAFYNGARELPELEDVADELTPYEEVRTFDVANFDKEGAKDLIKTAEVVAKEDEANTQAETAKEKITQGRNEKQETKDTDNSQSTDAENRLAQLREKYPDRVLGEQHEDRSVTFHDKDAILVGGLLGREVEGDKLTLSSEDVNKALQKLIANGHKVGLYEPIKDETPKKQLKITDVTKPQPEPKQEQPTLQLTNEQEEKPKKPRTSASSKGKIEDFGEKIGGARKDVARSRIRDVKNMTAKDLNSLKKGADDILSQANIIRLFKEGQMDEQTARQFLAFNNVAKVAKRKYSSTAANTALNKYRDAAVAWEEGRPIAFEITDADVREHMEAFPRAGEERIRESLNYTIIEPYTMFTRMYEAIDYPNVQRKLGQHIIMDYTIRKGRLVTKDYPYWVMNGYGALRGFPFKTLEGAVNKLKELCPEIKEGEKKEKGEKAEHGLRVVKEGSVFYIKSRNIPGNIYLSPRFWLERDAQDYLNKNLERLKEREQSLVVSLMGSNIGTAEREGVDYRNGKDVKPQDFLDEFGFRGVEFGNWVPQGERQMYLNKTYDAIKDFCAIVGISPRAFSLGGRLGLAFGARGKSRAMAHYEPLKEVINLTRMSGVGSLAHEWFHAVDNYLAKQKTGNISDMATVTHDVTRQELSDVFKELYNVMKSMDYAIRSRRAGDYWGMTEEEFARLFESYIYNKLAEKEMVSPILVRKDALLDEVGEDVRSRWPYPSKEENEKMQPYFDKLFDTIQEKTDENGNVVLFQRVDDSAMRRESDAVEEAMRDEVVRLMREAGIEVSTDWEAGQRILDDANADLLREMRAYHGSGADFNRFDHSFIGTGEGNQAFGWGTYVSEVEGVGKGYAKRIGDMKVSERRFIEGKIEEAKKYNIPAQVEYWENELERKNLKEAQHILYKVEIPQDNGSNYIDYFAKMQDQQGILDKIDDYMTNNEVYGFKWKRQNPDQRIQFRAGSRLITLTPNQSGADLYEEFKDAFGAKPASEILHAMGITGIKVPVNAMRGGNEKGEMNFVIFNENDLQITDKAKFFRTSNGEAYGFTLNGKVYLDPRIATAETPIHEYAHLWAQALREVNPKAWEKLKSEMLKEKDVIDYVKRLYPDITNEDELLEEVFTHYGGRRGAEMLRQQMQSEVVNTNDANEKTKIRNIFDKLRSLLDKFWNMARDLFAGENKNLASMKGEDFADMMMNDLINGFNPNERGEELRFRTTDTLPFYSNAARAVEQVKQDKATPEQWLKMIEKNGGLKSGEDKWIGLSDWLKASKAKSLTKQEVMDYIRQNQIQIEETEYADKTLGRYDEHWDYLRNWLEENTDNPNAWYNTITEYYGYRDGEGFFLNQGARMPKQVTDMVDRINKSIDKSNPINSTRLSYTTKGLENKREIALTVPTIESWNTQDEIHFGDAGQGRAVAWVRFGETTDAGGNRVLVIDEIQSKRHQEGRENGYQRELTDEERKEFDEIGKEYQKIVPPLKQKYGYGVLDTFRTHINDFSKEEIKQLVRAEEIMARQHELVDIHQKGIPSAPFEKNWHELAMKRMLRYAAENGYDKVAWTTGEQQAERYDIGGKVDWIQKGNDYGERTENIFFKIGNQTQDVEINNFGRIVDSSYMLKGSIGRPLSDLIGKELAARVMSAKSGKEGRISGNDLRIGGEGMKGFYDEILPRFMNKYGKKWGAKVGTVKLPNVEESARTMWAVDVTPEMKDSVMQGQPMFRQTQQGSAQRTTMQAIREAVNNIIDKLHIADRVTILETTEGLKGKKARAKGWFDVKTGKIVVVLPNNRNAADAMRTILHEGVAHFGLRELFGNNFDEFLQDVYSHSSESVRNKIDANAKKRGWSKAEATEEYLASLAETQNFEQAKKQGIWNKVKEWFNAMLNKVGIPKLFTTSYDDNELRYILWRSWRNLTEGGNRDYIGMAEDVVKREDLGVGEFARDADESPLVISDINGEHEVVKLTDTDLISAGSYNKAQVDRLNKWLKDNKETYVRLYHGTDASNPINDEGIKRTNNKNKHSYQSQNGYVYLSLYPSSARLFGELGVNKQGENVSVYAVDVKVKDLKPDTDQLNNKRLWGGEEYQAMGNTLAESLLYGNGARVKRDILPYELSDTLYREAEDNDIRFREDEEIEPTSDVARTVYDSVMSDRKKHIQEAWQDGMISIKEAQDAVLDTDDKPLRSYEDAYQFENHMHGISRNEAEYFERNLFKPLLQAINTLAKKSGKTANDVYRYLMLKHGLERNRVFAERDARKEHEAEIKKINDELKAREDAQKAQEKVVSDLQGKLNDTNLSQEEREKLEKKLKAAVEKLAEVTLTDKQKAAIEKRIKIENAKFDGLVNHIADPDVKAYYDQQLRTIGTLRANGQIDEEEYNKRMATLSNTYLHGNKDSYKWRDYSGLMAVTGADTLEEAERLANEEINDMEGLANEETKELWKAVNAATQWTLRKSFDSGEMTRDNYEAVKSMFEYYVPLRGWAETRASDVYDYMGGKGEVFSPVVRNAFGRMSEADNPIAYIGNMAVSAIVGGNKNLLKQHLLRFAQNHPNALFTVSEQWYQNTGTKQNPKWVAVSPDIPENATAEQIDAAIKQFDEDMKALEESGMATKKKGKLKVNYPEDNARLKEHQVRVRVNGREYVIYVNGNPRVAQAINGKLLAKARENSYESSKMANINREMAQNFTSRSPAFIFSNAFRDLSMAMAVVGIKEGWSYNKKFYATLGRVVFSPRAVRGGALMPMLMGMYLDGKIDGYIADTSNDKDLRTFARYFKEFTTNGGETGFTSLRDVDTFKRTMQKEYGRMEQGEADPRKLYRQMGEGFEYVNRCVEDMTRFVTYATSRQMGKSVFDSVTDAKNVTLNFNRKGSGAMGNATFRNYFIFANPAIQSLHLLWQLASDRRTRKAFTVTTLSFATAGALMPIVNAVIYALTGGGDDDDYWNLPTWVRRNNICFKFPHTGSFITIPLAQEFRVFYGLGELVASALLGHPDKNIALSVTEQVTDLLPISFTGANGNLAVNLAPTLLQPIMQVSNNVDFTGKPIRRVTPFNEDEPAFQKAYRGTPSWMVKSSELINDLTGGNEHSKGWIEGELVTALHLNYANDPAVVNHILKGYFGGMYSFISGTTGLATTALSGEMPKSYEVPILNRFINIPLERTEKGSIVLGEEYYGIKREMEKYQNEIRGFERDKKQRKEGASEIVDKMTKSDKYKHYMLINGFINKIEDARNKVKYIPDEKARENANIVMGELYDKLRKVDALTDGEAARLTQIKDNDEFNEIFSLPIGEMKKRLSE